jgi:hypothetical protein
VDFCSKWVLDRRWWGQAQHAGNGAKLLQSRLKSINPLTPLTNPEDTPTAIFASAMRSLCLSYLYRQYIAVIMKYIATSRLRERKLDSTSAPRRFGCSATSHG